jgi:hypothetical protein
VIRLVLGVVVLIALLFMADQEFANGRYTRKAEKAVMKVGKAFGYP